MKKALIAVLLTCASICFAQTTTPAATTPAPLQNVYAGGLSYNNSASPALAGSALYAHLLSGSSGTYAFTVLDVLPNTLRPFTVTTNISAGISQKLFTIGSVPIYVPTSAGVSFSGSNTGWAWSTGGLADVKLKGSWHLFPNVRLLKSSVSGGTGYQLTPGIMVGWGK